MEHTSGTAQVVVVVFVTLQRNKNILDVLERTKWHYTVALIDSPDCYGGLEAIRLAGSAVLARTLFGGPVLAAGPLAWFRTVPGYILHERVLLETIVKSR